MWFITYLQATFIGVLVYSMFHMVSGRHWVTFKISRNEYSLADVELNMEPLYEYTSLFVAQRLLSTTSVAGMLKHLEMQLRWPFSYVNSSYIDNSPTMLSGPCYSISLETEMLYEKVWHISVHKAFIINITIEQAYVAYTYLCESKDSHIAVNEGHMTSFCPQCDYTIEFYCGHVYMESTYSETNEATVKLTAFILNTPYSTVLEAKYSVLIDSMVYKFINYGDLKDTINKSRSTSLKYILQGISIDKRYYKLNTIFLIQKETLSLIWYIDNFDLLEHALHYQMLISVTEFNCWGNLPKFSVYRGLLSVFMMRYQVEPLAKIHCNTSNSHTISVTRHLYATVKLDTRVSEPFKFEMKLTMQMKASFFAGHSHVDYVHLSKPRPYLQFSSFSCEGSTSTVRSGLIQSTAQLRRYHDYDHFGKHMVFSIAL